MSLVRGNSLRKVGLSHYVYRHYLFVSQSKRPRIGPPRATNFKEQLIMSESFVGLAEALLPSVLAAGAKTMHYFRTGVETETKADGSPVTLADQAAEEILLEGLSRAAPGVPVVAEESMSAGKVPNLEDTFFLVDPLDGTREFINRRNEFTINIGLIRDKRPVFGIIFAPALSQLYLTLADDHAISAPLDPDAETCSLQGLNADRMRTSALNAESGMTIVASRSHGSEALENWLADVDVAGRANIGSSLKFCLVAAGKADVYPRFGPTMEWDTAAGHAIATAAGGMVTQTDGSPFLYGKLEKGFLNPSFIVWNSEGNPLLSRVRDGKR
ncbi:3'(2'),5'-bisphosphate nucleotidase [Filomicrobium insigne]|uniref:3'(2'),5'-bisphosphate nucleotidase CysQ n=2 Tax=Filomicrobium insigne TaxID=418854 RepID=A0A1H0NII4_9HYPH|nr:3'(2'),5'-bisphosphate nucleotidase [Filomicrobium insigne]